MTAAGRRLLILATVTCGICLSGRHTRPAGAATRDVVDALGRHVLAPVVPRRIVTLAPSIAETVYSLGAWSGVVGVSDFTDRPPDARDRPAVGGIVNPSIEKVLALQPDLVIATRESNRQETIAELDRLGLPVFVINPHGLEGILESVLQIGRALGRPHEAEQVVERLRARRDKVVARVRGLPRPRVLLVIWPDPVTTIGQHAFITEVLTAVGGQSVTADLTPEWPTISLEEVLQRDPDLLLLPAKGHQPITLDDLARRPGWDRVRAVRDRRVIYYDDSLYHSSPFAFDALERLATQLHPEAIR
jgi:iron complex transport system substrate-binding protein